MNFEERALRFSCQGCSLFGITALPAQEQSRGVLIVVGGPQYRAGSHRQFTLLARHLAAHGIPVMRFDYRGMGDSDGDARGFDDVNDDLRCAIDQFIAVAPSLNEVVIWGLCDAASAALFYAHQDLRVTGLVLVNPWIRTEEGIAKTYLKHYYVRRLFEKQLWKKIMRGKFDYAATAQSLAASFRSISRAGQNAPATEGDATLPQRMLEGLTRFQGRVLLLLAGNDLTAKEFDSHVKASRPWKNLLASNRVTRRELKDANHTFAQRDWRDQVAAWTEEWMRTW